MEFPQKVCIVLAEFPQSCFGSFLCGGRLMIMSLIRWCTTPPDVLRSVNKSKHLFRGPVLLKKSEPFLWG